MKLIKKTWQHRRDFEGLYECEKCGFQNKTSGYDDNNFHENVTPKMKCEKCGESTHSLGLKAEKVQTKYPKGFQI